MKEFVDKLISRLEEYVQSSDNKYHYLIDNAELNCVYDKSDLEDMRKQTFKETIEIANQLAEEYKVSEMPTGWKENIIERFERVE